MEKPAIKETPHLFALRSTVEEYMDAVDVAIAEGHEVDEDLVQYIFEAAMEAYYHQPWDYINQTD